uniref:B30.2/SPRY domain-containing protein n=1 Tax=Amphiprion percula TaxID=161767 RepID=A0A3P8RKU8_AMPPE
MKEIKVRHDAEQKRFEELILFFIYFFVHLCALSFIIENISSVIYHLGYYILSSPHRAQESAEMCRFLYPLDVTIDADTAGPWLLVSEDGKEVRQSPKKHRIPTSMARFTEDTFAVATQAFSTGRHYWEVGVKGKSNWLLGVASSSLRRNEHIVPCPDNGLWTLSHQDGGKYCALTKNPFPLMLSLPPQRVGVFVDYEERQVSFFNVLAKTHIYTFTGCKFTVLVCLWCPLPSPESAGIGSSPPRDPSEE